MDRNFFQIRCELILCLDESISLRTCHDVATTINDDISFDVERAQE